MKKIILCLLCICLLVGMSGCEEIEKLEAVELPPLPTATPDVSNVNENNDGEEGKGDMPSVDAAPLREKNTNHVIVNTKSTVYQEYDPAKGKEIILTFAYDTPNVYIEQRDEAAAKINEYLSLMDESYYTGNDHGQDSTVGAGGFNMMLELAQDNYAYVIGSKAEEMPLEFTSSRTAAVARADANVLSIVYSIYQYTGGAHGIYADRACVFDTETGDKLSLDRISSDYDSLAAFLTQYMVEQAQEDKNISKKIDNSFLPEEEYSAGFAALLREGSWYFNNNGLVIFSDIYEYGSYAQGMLEFAVPYELLEGKIKDEYMPGKRAGSAELEIKPLSEIEDGTTEIIDLVTVSEEGENICIIVSGTAYDVKISSVDYVERFFETAQLWYASHVDNSAIQLMAQIPEGMPNLMISYNDALGENHRLLISQSGEDGSLIFVDDSIQAVG